jgi:NifB/MoaA-like Fe-S oxidoreductase
MSKVVHLITMIFHIPHSSKYIPAEERAAIILSDDELARELIVMTDSCADELFLMARGKVPPRGYYDGFPQLENGIGMVRAFLDSWEQGRYRLAGLSTGAERVGLITGGLAAGFMVGLAAEAEAISGLRTEPIVVANDFFGPGITVTGLLTGRDILSAVAARDDLGCLVLPPNCLNEDGVTLDDLTVHALAERSDTDVVVGGWDLAASLGACAGTVVGHRSPS